MMNKLMVTFAVFVCSLTVLSQDKFDTYFDEILHIAEIKKQFKNRKDLELTKSFRPALVYVENKAGQRFQMCHGHIVESESKKESYLITNLSDILSVEASVVVEDLLTSEIFYVSKIEIFGDFHKL